MSEEPNIINTHPKPFEYYAASDLRTDEHSSAQMLKRHLGARPERPVIPETHDSRHWYHRTYRGAVTAPVSKRHFLAGLPDREKDHVRTVHKWLQSITPETLEQELAISGLNVTNVAGNAAGAPFSPDSTEFAIVAAVKGDYR